MNIRSGLTRVWLVGSLAWVIYCVWSSELVCPLTSLGFNVPSGGWCQFPVANPLGYYLGLVAKMVGWPAAALLLGVIGHWILAGFRQPSRTS